MPESVCLLHPGSSSSELRLLGVRPEHMADLYQTVYNAEIFAIPLCVIVATYANIYILLKR